MMIVLVLSISGTCAWARAAQDVDLCTLKLNSAKFDGQRIRIRGTVSLGFENFSIAAIDCSHPIASYIWLTFGGDFPEQAVYCCGDHSRRKHQDLVIQGRTIPLKRNAALEWFVQALNASRNRMPNGEPCENESCKFYRVTASLTGWFFARNTERGFGHLGCCSLFAIERVEDVDAERTLVPAGGQFECHKETWDMETDKAERLGLSTHCWDGTPAQCEAGSRSVMKQIAAHWGKEIELTEQTFRHSMDLGADVLTWQSQDLLTSFRMRGDHTEEKTTSITAEMCSLVAPVRTAASSPEQISCEEHSLSARDRWSNADIENFNSLIEKGQYVAAEQLDADRANDFSESQGQAWRAQQPNEAGMNILRRHARKWQLSLPWLRFEKCEENPPLPEQRYMRIACSWASGDGMQTFGVSFMRLATKGEEGAKSPELLLSGIGARICGATKLNNLDAGLRQ